MLGGGAGSGSANSNRADGQSVHSYEEIAASEVTSQFVFESVLREFCSFYFCYCLFNDPADDN